MTRDLAGRLLALIETSTDPVDAAATLNEVLSDSDWRWWASMDGGRLEVALLERELFDRMQSGREARPIGEIVAEVLEGIPVPGTLDLARVKRDWLTVLRRDPEEDQPPEPFQVANLLLDVEQLITEVERLRAELAKRT